MKFKRANKVLYIVLITLLLAVTALIGGWGISPAFADTSADTSVLGDLQKDSSFNVKDYPYREKDYSINVIQIAEGTANDLYIYTYQPSQKTTYLVASSINIAKQENNSLEMSFPNYKLTLISCDGVFCKYKVEGFELEKTAVRYYNISNILRPFEYLLDKLPAVGSESEVPNAVGQLWTVRTVGDSVEYGNTVSDVVTITQKYVGFLDYLDGITTSGAPGIYGDITAQHTLRNFVAFSTDRPIDQLKQVELQYALAECSYEYCANVYHAIADNSHGYQDYINRTKGEPVTQAPVVISADEKDENALHGWFGHKYRWDKIESTSDFLADQNNQNYELTNGAGVSSIEQTQWVLNFYKETATVTGKANLADGHIYCNYNAVSDVIILRLMFEYDGETFNLGVVDSKMTGDDKPLNGPAPLVDPLPTWAIALIVIGIVLVALVVLSIFVPAFGKVLGAPFMAIGRAIERRQQRTEPLRQLKLRQKDEMALYKYQNNLERKEAKRQRKLDEKEAQRERKAKDKREAARRKKAAENKRRAANTQNKKKGKGGKKK